ncbi:MAG: radical SAM family heme chaperone HemW [Bacteroidota bacterium]|nr:radical SAM family heme chaperone HemW [Bacteroidota bacterium]
MSGIYIHFPFCRKRCDYCDFYLITNLDVAGKFISSLKKEISIYSGFYKDEFFDTIFFGGGTPSILTPFQIEDILDHVYKNLNISPGSEISLESNPEDFIEKSLKDYRSAGINRISFGIQSFLDHELKFLTRLHSAEQAKDVVRAASVYFDNISLDIIYSLPSQTINHIDRSLSEAIALEVKHISAYTLTFEERTPLYKSFQKNLVSKNPDTVEGEMFNFVSGKLTSNGFKHYEVSNFAKENYQSRHNLKYWNYINYFGLGPSAHSMMNGVRWNNYRDIIKYNSLLEADILPVEEKYKLTSDQMKLEYIMLGLRSTGICFERYKKIFNEEFENVFSGAVNELVKNNFGYTGENNFMLNSKGFAIADEIVAKYF